MLLKQLQGESQQEVERIKKRIMKKEKELVGQTDGESEDMDVPASRNGTSSFLYVSFWSSSDGGKLPGSSSRMLMTSTTASNNHYLFHSTMYHQEEPWQHRDYDSWEENWEQRLREFRNFGTGILWLLVMRGIMFRCLTYRRRGNGGVGGGGEQRR